MGKNTVEEFLKESNLQLREAKQLHSGIFWILSDYNDLSDYKFLMFDVPCDQNGNLEGSPSIELNSKKGNSYNHKKLWESTVKNNNEHKPYNKKDYNYYPRGRVEVSNNKATIFLNSNLNEERFIDKIKEEFGLFPFNISEVRVVIDGSEHYQCFLDWI